MRTPNPSMVVALAALAVSLAGGATAATLITGRQVQDGTITARDLAPSVRAKINRLPTVGTVGRAGDNGQTGAAGASGAQGSIGASGAPGSAGTAGAAGATGVAGTARAYARVAADGTFSSSKAIVSVTVAAGSGGSVYCIIVGGGIDVSATAPVVTVAPPYPQSASAYIAWIRPSTSFCPSDTRLVEVETKSANSSGEWTNAGVPFRVVIP